MSFFKAYDMRGTFAVDFDLELVKKVGFALPKVLGGKRYLVGRDCRTTSEAVHNELITGLLAAGVEVTDIGLVTTPMVYFFTAEGKFDGSIMVTASHNPPSDNGLKVSKATALPVGYDTGLEEVEALTKSDEVIASDRMRPYETNVLGKYVEWMKSKVSFSGLSTLKIGVDCSNGMASILAHELFPNAIIINDTLDGTFPSHSPNPLKAEAREQIAELVKTEKLDCGVIFDGDADRCMFVDENGEFVQPDYLIPIIAREIGQGQGERVIHDVRTSRGAIDALKEMGFEPHMVPVGHAFAKPILRKIDAIGGGELAGHYYFRDFYGCDSGVFAALKILKAIAEAKAAGKSFSGLMVPISKKYASTGELNYRIEDKDAAIKRVLKMAEKSLPREISRSEMDGIRIEYENGWVNIRKSNTEPYLRLIAETTEKQELERWVKLLEGAIYDY